MDNINESSSVADASAEEAVWREHAFCAMVEALETAEIEYCFVGRVEDYPRIIESDVDFVVNQDSLGRVSSLLQGVAHSVHASVIQRIDHEVGARYFVISRAEGACVFYLHPDASGDYRRDGRLWMSAAQLLAGRRRHVKGFWTPSLQDDFLYYLIKRIDKRSIGPAQLAHLRLRWSQAPQACFDLLAERFGPDIADQTDYLMTSSDPQISMQAIEAMRAAMNADSQREGLFRRLRARVGDISRIIDRLINPTGLVVGFLGPDGSGKSTLIRGVQSQLVRAFRRDAYFHLRPRIFMSGAGFNTGPVIDPHAKPPRGAIASACKLFGLCVDYNLGWWVRVQPKRVRSTLVVFDRYLHDMLADPLRYRHSGPDVLLRLAAALVPKPDVWIVLDAPVEVLMSRKQEVSAENAALQRIAYQGLAKKLSNTLLVDTSRSIDECIEAINNHLISYLSNRLARKEGRRIS